jgi:hypothetical protein
MQKVVQFLEAKVEWFALGIALLFLGWTVWAYLINDPAQVVVENTPVGPASIDKFIADHSLQKLHSIMDPNAPIPDMRVGDYPGALKTKIALEPLQAPQLAAGSFDYEPFDVTNMPGVTTKMGPPVVSLPTLPPAQPLLTAAALDTIAPAQPNNAQPNNPPPAPGGAPGEAASSGKDIRVVVAAFTIPWNELYSQWQNSFGPAKAGQQPRLQPAEFQIVAVTAYRSERVNDKWSPDEQISILNGANLPPYPAAGNKNAETAYLVALKNHSNTLVAPDFPTVTAGVVWKDPTQLLPGTSNQPAAPEQSGTGNENYRTANMSEQLGGNSSGKDSSGGDSSGGSLSGLYAQGYGRAPGPIGGPPGRGGPPLGIPRGPYQPAPNPQQQQAPEQPTIIPPAPGTVDPVLKLVSSIPSPAPQPPTTTAKINLTSPTVNAKSPDLCLYIIDETAEAGRTYRYKISYKALNPLYNKPPEHVPAAHAAWVSQFDLEARASAYSPEIQVPQQTAFFCGKGQPSASAKNSFPFDVFTWTNGKWKKGTFVASLGDPIGGVDGAVDYATGWTFADQHNQHNKRWITLVDDEGAVDMRDASQDSSSPDYKKYTQWVEQTKNGVPQQQQPYNPGVPGGMLGIPGGIPPGVAPSPFMPPALPPNNYNPTPPGQ